MKTTRTYYRSSVLAFSKTTDYANAVTCYKRPLNADSCVMYTCAFAVVFLAVLLIVEPL